MIAHQAAVNTLLDINERQDRLTNVATIIQKALPATKAESPNPLLYVSAALVAGLCLGVFLALLIERFDDRIFSPEALAKYARTFPKIAFFSIDDTFGGWRKAQAKHFSDGGLFDQIYKP